MGANLAPIPFENNIGRRHANHFTGIGIKGIFARQQRLIPDATLAFAHQFAMLVIGTRQVIPYNTGVRNYDAGVTHVNKRFGDHLHRGKEAVDIIGTFHQHLQLSSPVAARLEKPIGILEVVMIRVLVGRFIAHRRRNNLALGQ